MAAVTYEEFIESLKRGDWKKLIEEREPELSPPVPPSETNTDALADHAEIKPAAEHEKHPLSEARSPLDRIQQFIDRFDCSIESVHFMIGGKAVPDKPCHSCHGRRYWLSTHAAFACAVCDPPASPTLVRACFYLRNAGDHKV